MNPCYRLLQQGFIRYKRALRDTLFLNPLIFQQTYHKKSPGSQEPGLFYHIISKLQSKFPAISP